MAEEKKSNNKRLFLIVIIALLAVTNGLLFYNNMTTTKERDEAVISMDSLKTVLEVEKTRLMAEIEGLQGDNSEKDSLLREQQNKVKELLAQVEEMMASGKITVAQLASARAQIRNFNKEKEKYQAKIDSLDKVNLGLSQDNETLSQRLDVEKIENQKITKERDNLSDKVALGSLMKAVDIVSSGIKVKGSGKEVTTSSAKKSDKLKVCFDILENRIADHGNKTIFLRIIGPGGSTLSIETRGSGSFTKANSGEEIQFTNSGTTEYSGDRKRVCMYWEQDTPFSKGTHQIEMYQEGHLIGESNLTLK